jgi:biotin carboxyl carrier protein|tara:strand:+ start:304 stop:447 length:144 start_codon:yes stop_codon:yes gene_type:complete
MECRGAGASEHTTEGYSLSQYADDVIELLVSEEDMVSEGQILAVVEN